MRNFTKKLRILLSNESKLKVTNGVQLSENNKVKIKSTLLSLLDYCSKKLNSQIDIIEVEYVIDKQNDFLIKFPPDSKKVIFNTEILQSCTLEFYIFIMVHEAVHGILQGLPNKKEVKKLTDYFNYWMSVVDVSADAQVAEFMSKKYNYTCRKYFEVYATGIPAFRDAEIRPHKLQRFISSMITIYSFFKTEKNEIFFIPDKPPSSLSDDKIILPIMHISNWGLCGVKWLNLTQKLYSEFTALYTNEKGLSSKSYAKKLMKTCKLLFISLEGEQINPINITFNN